MREKYDDTLVEEVQLDSEKAEMYSSSGFQDLTFVIRRMTEILHIG